MSRCLKAIMLTLVLSGCGELSDTNKSVGSDQIVAALDAERRSVVAEYDNCVSDEMRAGASLDAAGEGCAGVWTIAQEDIVSDLRARFPTADPEKLRSDASRFASSEGTRERLARQAEPKK